jgi:hypothetical protein
MSGFPKKAASTSVGAKGATNRMEQSLYERNQR